MGTRTALAVIQEARTLLNDEDAANYRFPTADLLKALNATQLDIVKAEPSAYTKVGNFALVAGSRQTVPSDCLKIMKPGANMGTGAVRGKMVEWMDYDGMTRFDRNWQVKPANAVCRYFLQNKEEHNYYYTYPPSTGSVYVEVNYSAPPPDSTINGVSGGTSDSVIPFDDTYYSTLLWGTLRRALMKDSLAANALLAEKYDQMFKETFAMDASGQIKIAKARS